MEFVEKINANVEFITNDTKDFWQYFISKNQSIVSFSMSVYDYFISEYAGNEIKIEVNNEETSYNEVAFSIKKSSTVFEEVNTKLQKIGLKSTNEINFKTKMLVSDNVEDRFIAMIYGIPFILINVKDYTLDSNIKIRSKYSPMMILPNKIFNRSTNKMLSLYEIFMYESMYPNFYQQNGIEIIDNTAEEIFEAIKEMSERIEGTIEINNEEKGMIDNCKRIIDKIKSDSQADIYDENISLNFLKHNEDFLGRYYNAKDKFKLENFLSSEKLSKIKLKKKIKIRANWSTWNAAKTVCEALQADDEVDFLIVEETERYESEHIYKRVHIKDYDIETDKPDVFIIAEIYMEAHIQIGKIREYSRMVVVVPQSLIMYQGYDIFVYLVDGHLAPYNPDYYLYDSMLYKKLKDTNYFKDKPLIEMGNASYDVIYEACQKREVPKGWEKLLGKKILMYSTDHGLDEYAGVKDDLTFDLYGKEIFSYVEKHKDIGLIFRPHPYLMTEIMEQYYTWSEEDLQKFRTYCAESENIIFDELKDCAKAFAMTDAIISDSMTGMTALGLPMNKPTCLLYRTKNSPNIHPELSDNYYKAYSKIEVKNFLDMFRRGEDPMYEQRKSAAENFVLHFDGKNGQRIKEFIIEKYKEKFMKETN